MKYITKIWFVLSVAFMAAVSCVSLGDLDLEPVPDIAFDYKSDGLTLTFTSVAEGTSGITWEIIGQEGAKGSGETFTYTFPKPGNYWVQMKGTYGGREQVFSGKILVAKPSVVKLDDNSFLDWDLVNYEDFNLTAVSAEGGDEVGSGKIDYDANYVYIYLELATTLPSCNEEQAIMKIKLDSDNKTATGISESSMGVDWMLEGNFWAAGWASWYNNSTGENVEDLTKSQKLGTYVVKDGKMYMEFGISRKDFNISSSSCVMLIKFYNEDWNDAIYINCNGKDSFVVAMDKQQ